MNLADMLTAAEHYIMRPLRNDEIVMVAQLHAAKRNITEVCKVLDAEAVAAVQPGDEDHEAAYVPAAKTAQRVLRNKVVADATAMG